MPGKPRGLSCREDVLSPQEFNMLLFACNSLKDKFIVYLLVFSGLRVSELKHLRRSWVNIEETTVTIPTRQYCTCAECNYLNPKTGKYKYGIWKPKTKKGARTILIHPMLLPVMREFLANNESLGISRVAIWAHVKKIARQAHIFRNVYPHCLRATAATMLSLEKISAPSLKYTMGWSSLQAAEDYIKSEMHQAHSELNQIYQKGTGRT
ncbi:tyrosine-type recombinase/integrase [Chloroflexota bacterium]